MSLFALALLLLGAQPIAPAQGSPPPFRVAATVALVEGRCTYWTGDVGLNAKQFRASLRESISGGGDVTIYHGKDVPERCLKKARSLAAQAGYRNIALETGKVDLSLP